MAARPTEIEAAEALHACSAENFPVHEHVRAQREVLVQARGPGHREAVFEGQRNQAAHWRAAFPYQGDPSAVSKRIQDGADRKSTRLNSSHGYISYAVFCLKKKKKHK